MAEEDNNSAKAPAKKKLPMKMIIVLAVVMVVEGAIIGGGILLFGDDPPSVQAEGLQKDNKAAEFELVEVLLIGDKFQNTRQGSQAYLYDATIYVVVRQMHRDYVETEIEKNMARISGKVSEIFARAEPSELNAADRLSLKRKILAMCHEDAFFGRIEGGAPPLPASSRSQ